MSIALQECIMSVELDQLAEELTLRIEVDEDSNIRYYNSDNKLHRSHGPATIFIDGSNVWYQNGELHRLDGPAVMYSNGDEFWFINGIRYFEEEFNAHPLVIEYAKSK